MRDGAAPRLLLLEDDETDLGLAAGIAANCGFAVSQAMTVANAKELIAKAPFDVLVVDIKLRFEPTNQLEAGWRFLEEFSTAGTFRIIIWSAMVEGQLLPAKVIGRSLFCIIEKPGVRELERELRRAAVQLAAERCDAWIRESRADQELDTTLGQVAATDLPVLIVGPTGAGKEMVAQEIASKSGRDRTRIRTVNCGAFEEGVLMSELFGHVRGSYTGAQSHRLGLILEASGYDHMATQGGTRDGQTKDYALWLRVAGRRDQRLTLVDPGKGSRATGLPVAEGYYELPEHIVGGTLILDEVAELSPRAQAALLRVLDGRPIKPVGYEGPGFLPNVRLISIANDEKRIAALRRDLRERLVGVVVRVPSIASRPETARGIVMQAIRHMGFRDQDGARGFPWLHKEDSELLTNAAWSYLARCLERMHGGVRQLIWFVMRAAMLARGEGPVDEKHVLDADRSGFSWSPSAEVPPDSMARALGLPAELCLQALPDVTLDGLRYLYERSEEITQVKDLEAMFSRNQRGSEARARLYILAGLIGPVAKRVALMGATQASLRTRKSEAARQLKIRNNDEEIVAYLKSDWPKGGSSPGVEPPASA